MKKVGFLNRIGVRITVPALVIVGVVVAVTFWIFFDGYRQAATEHLVSNAANFVALTASSQEQMQLMMDQDEDVEDAMIADEAYVHSSWHAAMRAAEEQGLAFRITVPDANDPDNDPAADESSGQFRLALYDDLVTQIGRGGADRLWAIDESAQPDALPAGDSHGRILRGVP